ncbi:MAG: helix-turn-helix domain-containing protein [Acidimicrobiia bacterium]|nr:helix-turn-helix domain-containing protein [Acidimicrobiia bacterium]
MEPDDPRIRAIVKAVASALREQLPAVAADVEQAIVDAIPDLAGDDAAALRAGIGDSVDAVLRVLAEDSSPEAPPAAIEDAQRFAQRGVPAVVLIRAYRVGQARFLALCMDQLLGQTDGDGVEVQASRAMVAAASQYSDHVVEKVVSAYEEHRDAWVRDRSAVLAMRIRAVLRGDAVDISATERTLGYRFDRDHQALVLWVDDHELDAHARMRRVVRALGDFAGDGGPLVVPLDESTMWAWLPVASSVLAGDELAVAVKAEPSVIAAVGEPVRGLEGFRRSHRQATDARGVALAAGPARMTITPFADVAPISMLCRDLEAARDWVHETLGELAIESARNEGLRETALVFLQTGGSYTATAEQLFLHRNTAQYRVRKAEEARGRPLRDGRLDVELALLACRWLKGSVLRPPAP